MSMKTFIVAGDRIVDSEGSHQGTEKILRLARKKNFQISTLEIVTLAKRWEDKLKSHEFKSGASAMAGIERARRLLRSRKADLVVLKGQDMLKTGYEHAAREKYMKLYEGKYTPLDGYNDLVPLFLASQKLSESEYFDIRNALFENYIKTWKRFNPEGSLPNEKWFQPLTKYFRGVDCANPNVDYSGQMILTTESVAMSLKIPKKERVQILGNAFTKLKIDGLESLPKISSYLHLKRTLDNAEAEAKIRFKTKFFGGEALLDAYTCYPVVPMGLILRLGLVKSLSAIPEFLQSHEITVTGGLNLVKAPWNLTSLNALIVMRQRLMASKKKKYGLVHGNGSLGNQQGITILKRN
jgi:hypothetical protein